MKKRNIIALLVVAALSVGGIALATAGGTADDPGQQAAVDAALKAVPGELLEVEAEDNGDAGYEVEIRTADGAEVEVHVDTEGNVVGMNSDDSDGGHENEGGGHDNDSDGS